MRRVSNPSSLDASVLSRHDATSGMRERTGGAEGMGDLQVRRGGNEREKGKCHWERAHAYKGY